MESKVVSAARVAVGDVRPGASIMVGGFAVLHGWPNTLLQALAAHGAGDLTVIGNTLGFGRFSPQVLAERRLVSKFIGSFGGFVQRPTPSEEQILAGEITFEIVPQGTLAERIRAAGAGLPAFYTPVGVGTVVDTPDRESREIDGRRYLLERALTADFALLRARTADEIGNLRFDGAQQNFNPSMAAAAQTVIAEVEEIVPVGTLRPEEIDVPGIYVDRVVRAEIPLQDVLAEVIAAGRDPLARATPEAETVGIPRDLMALRVARMTAGYHYVNLGIGLPTLVGGYLAQVGSQAHLHAQNGMLGYESVEDLDAWDPDFYNAGGQPVASVPGTSTFDSVAAFAMARGGHLDAVVLGGLQVSQRGDLANWRIPGRGAGGIGGAMDLVAGDTDLIVLMEHTTRDHQPRIVEECTFPLTGLRCVNTIVTNLAVIEVTADGLRLREVAPGVSPGEVAAATGCPLIIPDQVPSMDL